MKTITAGGKVYDLYCAKGHVEETGKNMETRVSGGGGGGATFGGYGATAPVSIQSHTVVHDQLFLTDKAGNEHSFQLQGFNVACRVGNELSVLWAVKRGNKTGDYIAVYNYTTGNVFYSKGTLEALFRRPALYMLGAMVLCIILGSFMSIFYYGIVLIPIAWFIEGYMGAKKFKNEINYNEFE
ncbi:MAG: hypothetical protein JWN56_2079 [Sphingobacteriales bacterium]|nr:hypothetical protein [Sphingobacteriales bacterium]